MKKSLSIAAAFVAVVIAAWLLLAGRGGASALVGEDVHILLYTLSDVPTGHAAVSVPYMGDAEGLLINVALDRDGDGAFADEEWLVRNMPTRVRGQYVNRFTVPSAGLERIDEDVRMHVSLTRDLLNAPPSSGRNAMERMASIRIHEISTYADLTAEGASPEWKRGIGIVPSARAHHDEFSVSFDGDMPHFTAGPMDCFPIAAANNITALARKNGRQNDIPSDPSALINELREDMRWSPRGVTNGQFLEGKNAFIERYNLPITTERIDEPSIDDIRKALESGGAIELSMIHTASASGHAPTGHVVTVTGAAGADGQQGVFAHDPATPEGADMLELFAPAEGQRFWRMAYPAWDGETWLEAIFVQHWAMQEEETTRVMPSESEEPLLDSRVPLDVLVIGGKHYPAMQFHIGEHGECKEDHYHSVHPFVVSLEGDRLRDPDPGSCGFGLVDAVPTITVDVDLATASQFLGESWRRE